MQPKSHRHARVAALVVALTTATLGWLAPPVSAQDADEISPLLEVEDLARVMGAIHYRRQSCTSARDQAWRDQAMRLMELEAPVNDQRRQRLVAAFNEGYNFEQDARPTCAAGRTAEIQLATEGKRLAERLLNRYVQ